MRGRVVEAAGDTVLVELEPEAPRAACGCCGAGPGCPAPCAPRPPALVRVENPGEPELGPGQTVKLRRGGLVSQAAAALLPPIAGFALGYVLAARFSPEGPAGEGARAAAGLITMVLSALAVYLFRRRHQPRVFYRFTRGLPRGAGTYGSF